MTQLFEAFDEGGLELFHMLQTYAGDILTPLAKFFTYVGENGIWMFVLAGVLMCFAKTRKIGICLFGAVSCGVLITTFIFKDLVARIRPMELDAYRNWWIQAGAMVEYGFSFPSGHATTAAAGITALALVWNKKVLIPGVPYVILMCCSRVYLIAHYPTDVLAGVVVGIFSGIVAYLITLGIYKLLNIFSHWKICQWLLTDIDAGKLFKRKQ